MLPTHVVIVSGRGGSPTYYRERKGACRWDINGTLWTDIWIDIDEYLIQLFKILLIGRWHLIMHVERTLMPLCLLK